MKRTWIIAAGMLVLSGAIYVSSRLMAQPGASAPGRTAAPQTRIALCNLSAVIKGYQKYKNFQAEIKVEVEKFQAKDKDLRTNLEGWVKIAEKPETPADKKAEAQKNVLTYKHLIEDLGTEAKTVLGKKSDEQMVILYKEVREATQRFASSQGIELVLHYNDADEKNEYAAFWSAAKVARKMQAGACMPMYITPGMDISDSLLQMLNSQVAPATGVAPAARTTPP